MKILKINAKNVFMEVTKTLKKGGLVIFPSDTVYGALVDATNNDAVKKLIAFKNRPPGKAISVFVRDFRMLEEYVCLNHKQKSVLQQILPGCFTIILKSKHKTSKLLEAENGSLGIRIPNYQPVNNLLNLFGKPVTATSANLAGQSPCYSIKSLLNSLSKTKEKLIDLVVDAGELPRNKPSTIIDLGKDKVEIIRQGDIGFNREEIYVSNSPEQTKQLAKKIYKNIKYPQDKPLVFIIKGELGVGKTVFVKGLGELFGIKNIISPSYVIYYEYKLKDKIFDEFVHLDLYNIDSNEELDYLNLQSYLAGKNLLIFEWGEKAGRIFDLIKSKAHVVFVQINYKNLTKRRLVVNTNYTQEISSDNDSGQACLPAGRPE